MIHEDTNRSNWNLGVITELIPGLDGIVRIAKVRSQNKIFTRPITKLFPLEITADPNDPLQKCTDEFISNRLPSRKAKTDALKKFKNV